MFGIGCMEVAEMLAIERQGSAVISVGECQDERIGNALASLPNLPCGQNVVAPASQAFNDRQREVLIGVKPDRRLCALIFGDLTVDLVAVSRDETPSVREILGAERGIAA